MSAGERLEAVRRIYERWGRGDFRAGPELFDPGIEFILRPEFPDAGTYHGAEEIRRYMREDFLHDLEDASITGEEFAEAGDSVVVRVLQQATGPESGLEVAMRYYHVWTFRGRSVIRLESIKTRAEALEAVGLEEWPPR